MIGYFGYTVVFSYLNVISSMVGIYYALNGDIKFAIICLMVSGICDMLDGPIARTKKNRTDRERSFGIQIDSLADVVSFGIFPVVIGYALGLTEKYHFVIMAIYVLAAIIRLAFFNATEIELQNENIKRTHYLGLPVTSAAVIIPALCSVYLKFSFKHIEIAYSVVLVVLSIAFLAKFKLPKIKFRYLVVLCVLAIPVTYFIATLPAN